MISIIIPVINLDLLKELLQSISVNTLKPKRVILIDNTKEKKHKIFEQIPLSNGFFTEVCYSETGLVNESLNLGREYLSKTCEYAAFLNDDIVLLDCFFQRNLELFKKNENCGVAVPRTVTSIEELKKGKVSPRIINKREGWAFTIRKSLLDDIPPIPCDRIATFHGDDWIWYHTNPKRNYWYKDLGNVIFHHVGSSILKLGFRAHKRLERNEFVKIAIEKGWSE